MKRLASVLVPVVALAAGCAADRPPDEVTSDGLARVPAPSEAGVYRTPGADFTRYRRIILEPPSISFVDNWREKHPEVSTAEIARILHETVDLFRQEFTRELVEAGSYEFAEDLGPDVLLVIPTIEDLDIGAPEQGNVIRPISMKITGDLRDALSSEVLGRVITYQPAERFSMYGWRTANRATNAHEQRMAFMKWSRRVREALNVAKTERPRSPVAAQEEGGAAIQPE
jgi:hypothetical protein